MKHSLVRTQPTAPLTPELKTSFHRQLQRSKRAIRKAVTKYPSTLDYAQLWKGCPMENRLQSMEGVSDTCISLIPHTLTVLCPSPRHTQATKRSDPLPFCHTSSPRQSGHAKRDQGTHPTGWYPRVTAFLELTLPSHLSQAWDRIGDLLPFQHILKRHLQKETAVPFSTPGGTPMRTTNNKHYTTTASLEPGKETSQAVQVQTAPACSLT